MAAKKHAHSRGVFVATKWSLVYGIAIVFLFIGIASFAFRAEADMATIVPGLYSVTGTDLDDGEGDAASHVQYEYEWSNFSGEIPKTALVDSITLRLAWSFTEKDVEPVANPEMEVQDDSFDESGVIGTGTPSENREDTTSEGESSTPLPVEDMPIQEDDSEVLQEETSSTEEIEDSTSVEEEAPRTEEPLLETKREVPNFVSDATSYSLMFAEAEEETITEATENHGDDVSEDSVTETHDNETSLIPSEPAVSEEIVSGVEERYDTSLFEVLYSLDGQSWKQFGEGNFLSNEMTFVVPQFTVEDIANLKIKVQFVSKERSAAKIYFDVVNLEVAYTAEVVEPGISGPVDLEPNFSISTVKADVQSGNLRAVIIEKGGMYELWYALTDTATHKVVWNRLVNDGSLDVSANLAIKGRTLFWLDKNQQTLFGFNIDDQSIFGESLTPTGDDSTSLRFKDERHTQREVSFDFENNTFEFSK